ncbi:hypothetical protein [Nocardia iowensis]
MVGIGASGEQEAAAQEGLGQLVAWVDQRQLSPGSAVTERADADTGSVSG